MTWTTGPRHLADLAFRLADDGTAAAEAELAQVAAEARGRGLVPGAVAALEDPGTPEVVRLRAFGLVAAALATGPAAAPAVVSAPPAAATAAVSAATAASGVDQRLDPLGDLGQDLPVAVGSSG